MSSLKANSNAWAERRKVGFIIPPPILLVLLILVSVKIHLMLFTSFDLYPLMVIFAVGVMFSGLILTTYCIVLFRANGTPVRPTEPVTTVVVSGPYAYSRNPIYLGMLIFLSGMGILLSSPVFIITVILFWVIVHFGAVLPEERYLLRTQGQAYHQYQQQVRRWL